MNLVRYYQIFSNRCDLVTYLSHLLLATSSSSNIVIYCWKVGNISCWGLSKNPLQHFLYNICVINIIWSQNVKVSSCYKIKKVPNSPLQETISKMKEISTNRKYFCNVEISNAQDKKFRTVLFALLGCPRLGCLIKVGCQGCPRLGCLIKSAFSASDKLCKQNDNFNHNNNDR